MTTRLGSFLHFCFSTLSSRDCATASSRLPSLAPSYCADDARYGQKAKACSLALRVAIADNAGRCWSLFLAALQIANLLFRQSLPRLPSFGLLVVALLFAPASLHPTSSCPFYFSTFLPYSPLMLAVVHLPNFFFVRCPFPLDLHSRLPVPTLCSNSLFKSHFTKFAQRLLVTLRTSIPRHITFPKPASYLRPTYELVLQLSQLHLATKKLSTIVRV